ncbi:hypothetical protein [Nocardia altamirensis]|uniref:hypothetical protein n=1 Tax=Nocardia altamirensis TaxID=472158 RepID=UPI00084071D4|nr:hypothetical protein [Nocardia altamirensis]
MNDHNTEVAMSELADPAIPKAVRSWIRDFREVGLEPEVEHIERRWRLSVTTEHAATELWLKRTPSGSWKWADASLTVDGEPRPLAHDAADLARIFREANQACELVQADPMPPPCAPDSAPPRVQQEYWALVRHIGDETQIQLGRDGNQWFIGLDAGGAALRMRFRRTRTEGLLMRLQVIVDGQDRSEQARGDLAQALQLMMPAQESGPADPGMNPSSAALPASSAGSRKGTVMRN